MPIYEYKCTVCDDRFDIEQRISDDPLTSLEGCQVEGDGTHQLKKVFSAIGIAFKGDGFYRNDARTKPSSKASTPSSETSTSSADTSSTSSESSNGDSSTSSSSTSSSGDSSSSKSSSSTSSSSGDSPVAAKSSSS